MSRISELAHEIEHLSEQWTHAAAARLKRIAAELHLIASPPIEPPPVETPAPSVIERADGQIVEDHP
jgi:NaMN:DMB phosphoribosyltransferase